MIKLSLTFAFLFGVIICNGQTYKLDKDTTKFKEHPLIVLKFSLLSSLQTSNLLVNRTNIDSLNVYKNSTTIEQYGKSAVNGVIVVVLKRGTKLIGFNDLLSKFDIASSERNLPVFIDSAISYRPQNSYFEASAIKYVQIENEKETGMKYISIRSVFDIVIPKKGDIYIR